MVRWRQCSPQPNTCFLGPPDSQSPPPKRQLDRFSRFCTAHCRQSPYFTTGRPFLPQNCPSHGGSGTHLIHSNLGPPESTTQTASSKSVQPFLQGSRSWQTETDRPTDRHTDGHATPSVTIGRIYMCSLWCGLTESNILCIFRNKHLVYRPTNVCAAWFERVVAIIVQLANHLQLWTVHQPSVSSTRRVVHRSLLQQLAA